MPDLNLLGKVRGYTLFFGWPLSRQSKHEPQALECYLNKEAGQVVARDTMRWLDLVGCVFTGQLQSSMASAIRGHVSSVTSVMSSSDDRGMIATSFFSAEQLAHVSGPRRRCSAAELVRILPGVDLLIV